jgi:predicted HicB family RNase H-like nuclease
MPDSVKTKSGRVFTASEIDQLAAEAERGFDLSTWAPRRGRPPLGATAGAHSPRIAVRIPEDLHRRAMKRAAEEGRSISDVVRELLERYAPASDSR